MIEILITIALVISSFCFGFYVAIYFTLTTKNEKTKAKFISSWELTKKVNK